MEALDLESVQLVNDFVAQSMAVRLLRDEDTCALGAPTRIGMDGSDRTWAVIGPGTGLGVGALVSRDGQAWALATEGGHASFAPGTPEEIAILERLSGDFGRVSNERIVSGSGLVNLHCAISQIAGLDPGPMRPEDVTAGAEAGDRRCMRAVDVFCAVFGAIAGDLVLTMGAWGGVYLSGGMVPPLLRSLQHSGFRQRFEGKGRYAPAMARVPTIVVLHPHPGLRGAAALPLSRCSGSIPAPTRMPGAGRLRSRSPAPCGAGWRRRRGPGCWCRAAAPLPRCSRPSRRRRWTGAGSTWAWSTNAGW